MEWYTWVFGGIGVFALTLFVGKTVSVKRKSVQRQKSGDNSTNVQSGRDTNLGKPDSS